METKEIIGETIYYSDGNYKQLFHNRTIYRNSNNQLHRLDGPAVEYFKKNDGGVNGFSIYITRSEYWVNGIRHRLDGPALKLASGTEIWYKDGLKHCAIGPAYVKYKLGQQYPLIEFWMNGIHFEGVSSVEEMIIKNIIE